ncbi:hypothetical protein [Dipodfec virus RodF1_38]|uniref:Uncharacterized protein n=1 Tax=Dipodfec virus RodF1_38 TaxID=2929296 RepID=A0A976N2I2_9VIRU|nr:hypothetical protein [Dipodfec virus RodF1_38]
MKNCIALTHLHPASPLYIANVFEGGTAKEKPNHLTSAEVFDASKNVFGATAIFDRLFDTIESRDTDDPDLLVIHSESVADLITDLKELTDLEIGFDDKSLYILF